MSLSPRIRNYLDAQKIPYQLVQHDYSETARGCAEAAHIPPKRMAKAVLLKDADDHFMVAVIPADKSVDLHRISLRTNRLYDIASQHDVNDLFGSRGAVPAVSQPWGLPVIWDDQILEQPDCYLEAGDHEALIYLSRSEFRHLMEERDHGIICH